MDFMKKKKDEQGMSPIDQQAKMSVLGGMKDGAEQDMLSKLKGLGAAPQAAPEAVEEAAEVSDPLASESTQNPIMELADQMSSEELQELIDQLVEKKGVMDGQPSFKPDAKVFK